MSSPAESPDPASPWLGASTVHYENFPVGSWLVPAPLRPAVTAIYRFARYADDVADEGPAPASQRLAELQRLRDALQDPPRSSHPYVAPLQPWIERFSLDRQLFVDLLSAFEQDVTVTRHADRSALLDYSARSANPVGRLMLQLFDQREVRCLQWSDAICSALQLVNFLQDVERDWHKGRVYLPMAALASAGLDDRVIGEAVTQRRAPPALRMVIERESAYARSLLESGRPLVRHVPWRFGLELRAILAGGLRILDKLRIEGFDPIASRPVIRPSDAPALLRMMFR